ncbi:MAG: hypothetical protein VB111_09165 [Clostridiaceae bacterium]|nr:hypothetical protein [Clostridiaceae bacterium]
MKKALCFALAMVALLSLAACDNGGSSVQTTSTTTPAFSTPAADVNASDALASFFNNDMDNRLAAMSGVLYSFACAVQDYPDVIANVPDENFGWTYFYNMLVYNGITCDGVTATKDGFTISAAAFEKLQRDTLGGAVWKTVSPDLAEYVTYNEDKEIYTVKSGRETKLGAYIEKVTYREDASCAELTVAVYDTAAGSDLGSAVVGRYYIDLRAHEESAYGYIIAAFSRAE